MATDVEATLRKASAPIRAVLELELSLGNSVAGVESYGPPCPICITMRERLHLDAIRSKLGFPNATVELWHNRDTHYPLETGFKHDLAPDERNTIAGPLIDAQ